MESETKNWWRRLTDTLKKSHRDDEPELPAVGENGLLAGPAEPIVGSESEPAADKPPGALARWTKRDQALTQLQEGYERVNQLIADMQRHMVSQSERTERMCNSLEQLSRSMAEVPAVSEQQARTLESIVGQLETANTRTQQLAGAVGELPKVARAQTETLTGINRQLEMVGEQSVVTCQTMEKVGTAISSVGDTSGAQTKILKQMNYRVDEQNERINQLIASQGKRFVMLFVVTALLAVAAIAAVVVSLALRT